MADDDLRDPGFIRRMRTHAAKVVPAAGVRSLPPAPNPDVSLQMWKGAGVVFPRGRRPDIDRPINIVPTAEREPESAPPNAPVWVNANCPPWVCPPFWSVPVDLTFEGCVPTYEQAILLSPCYTVPQDYVLVIRGIGWEVHNAAQFDVFQHEFLVDGALRMQVEDMLVDAAATNPAVQCALGTTLRMMPTHLVIDRNHTLCIRSILRGQIDINGNSPNFPGQPITTGDCTMRVFVQGWLANLRDNLDGGPRPTDLGDAGGFLLDDVQGRGGYP